MVKRRRINKWLGRLYRHNSRFVTNYRKAERKRYFEGSKTKTHIELIIKDTTGGATDYANLNTIGTEQWGF